MYAKSFSILALAAASLVAAEDFTVATPAYVQQCAPLKISWKGGEPPYRPFITAPGKIDDVKASIDQTDSTTTTWTVTVPEGQKFTINVCDNSGQCQASGVAGPVGKGKDDCLNGGDSKSSGGSGGAAAAGGGGSSGGDDSKNSDGDDNKNSDGDDNKSSSSSDNKSSSSSGGKSSSSSSPSSTGGGSGGGSSSAKPSSTGMGGGSGSDDKNGQDGKDGDSDNNGGDKKDDSGAMSFSGVPAVVAGVVGVVVAALI